jgi:hypothetical protein
MLSNTQDNLNIHYGPNSPSVLGRLTGLKYNISAIKDKLIASKISRGKLLQFFTQYLKEALLENQRDIYQLFTDSTKYIAQCQETGH